MTIIELMAAVVVVGIVAAMAVPRFEIAFERMGARSANRDLNSVLKLARSTAISDKQPTGVYFDADNHTYTIFKDFINTGGQDFVSGDSAIRTDSLPPDFSLLLTDVENDVIIFRPNGSAKFVGRGNIFTYVATDNINSLASHNILASTGRVQSNSYYY